MEKNEVKKNNVRTLPPYMWSILEKKKKEISLIFLFLHPKRFNDFFPIELFTL